MTDEEQHATVSAAIDGDRAALASLWRAHRRWVAAVLLAHAPSGADLDDLLQDVALKLCRSIATLDDASRFLAWLRAIALNTARSAGRRSSLRVPRERALSPGDAEPEDRLDAARRDAREEHEHVLAALDGLDADYREPLLMKAIHGMSQRHIARILEIPETTVETRLARGRRLLRERIALQDGIEPRDATQRAREPRHREIER